MTGGLVYVAALTDKGYRHAHAVLPGRVIPMAVVCPTCGGRAPFRADRLAARYECERCGHAMAAMHADGNVAGAEALRPWPEA